MKKIIRIFLLVVGVFAIGGCSSNVAVTDVSSLVYKEGTSYEDIAYNLNLALGEIKGAKFEGTLSVKDKKYDFSGEVIVGETIKDSIVHIQYKDNNLYVKKDKVYLSYYYNNTNVIVKDTVDNFADEVISLLESKGKKCDEKKIFNILSNKSVEDINADILSKYVSREGDGFVMDYRGSKAYFNSKYLPVSIEYAKKDVSIEVDISYTPVSIKVPLGYNILTLDIEGIKDLLKVDNISELIK